MGDDLLARGFGIWGLVYSSCHPSKENIVFESELADHLLKCSSCGETHVIRHGMELRRIRIPPIGSKPSYLDVWVPRVECEKCGAIRRVHLPFAGPRLSYSHSFALYVLGLSRYMTILDIAQHLHISWDTVKEIIKADLKKNYEKPRLRDIELLGIDEIYVGKKKFFTIVLDLVSGKVVFVGNGKGAVALLPFWRRLKASGAKIKAVAIDMGQAYISAVQKHLKEAVIVFDHFHVMKLMNEKIDVLRRAIQRQAEGLGESCIKGIRFLLLKNKENLDDQKKEGERLQKALTINKPLAIAYYLKEDLRQFWNQRGFKEGMEFLKGWANRALGSGINVLKKFANLLLGYRYGLCNYFNYRISTGPLEGTNNKIRTMSRQAYGYRDMEFFKLRIKSIHKAKYALIG